MLTRISKSQELTTTIADFLLVLHLGYGSCGLAVASSPCILFILSIFFSLVSRLKRQPLCETFHTPRRCKKKNPKELVDTHKGSSIFCLELALQLILDWPKWVTWPIGEGNISRLPVTWQEATMCSLLTKRATNIWQLTLIKFPQSPMKNFIPC